MVNDKSLKHGAALSYYTVFSLPPLLLIVIALAGIAFGEEAARGLPRVLRRGDGPLRAVVQVPSRREDSLEGRLARRGSDSRPFTIGKFLIGLYLGKSDFASTYGTAGSLVVLLAWIFYSSQILFFGAEFTQVYANRYGSHITPQPYAEPIKIEDDRKRKAA